MVGTLSYSYREGNRSEYLAQFLLSSLGVVVQVPRQEDVGVDFYCSLAERESNRLTFHSPFLLQVKSESEPTLRVGGYGDRCSRIKSEGVDWLFGQELPLLYGIVSRTRNSIELFTTSPMWAARYEGTPSFEIRLIPRCGEQGGDVALPRIERDGSLPESVPEDRFWSVDLGPQLRFLTSQASMIEAN